LVSNGLEFMPDGDKRFKKSERLVSYFEIKRPPPQATGAMHVQFRIRVTDPKTSERKEQTAWRPIEAPIRPENRFIPVVSLGTLPAGAYRLNVQASHAAGHPADWRAICFAVE
jgi:hypothetical protein